MDGKSKRKDGLGGKTTNAELTALVLAVILLSVVLQCCSAFSPIEKASLKNAAAAATAASAATLTYFIQNVARGVSVELAVEHHSPCRHHQQQ